MESTSSSTASTIFINSQLLLNLCWCYLHHTPCLAYNPPILSEFPSSPLLGMVKPLLKPPLCASPNPYLASSTDVLCTCWKGRSSYLVDRSVTRMYSSQGLTALLVLGSPFSVVTPYLVILSIWCKASYASLPALISAILPSSTSPKSCFHTSESRCGR